MMLSFPTRDRGAHTPGTPARAEPCRCIGGPIVGSAGETCTRCGRYPDITIRHTWHQRAQDIARTNRFRKALARGRKA